MARFEDQDFDSILRFQGEDTKAHGLQRGTQVVLFISMCMSVVRLYLPLNSNKILKPGRFFLQIVKHLYSRCLRSLAGFAECLLVQTVTHLQKNQHTGFQVYKPGATA